MGERELVDPLTEQPLPTKAFEYGLERDTDEVDFSALGQETRRLIYKPLVKLQMLKRFLVAGLPGMIGQGFTQDTPKIGRELLSSQFYRVLHDQFFEAHKEWLSELARNRRHVTLFNLGEEQLSRLVRNVNTRRGFFGSKTVDHNTFKAAMNKLSRDAGSRYSDKSVEFKLFDLFDRAADKILAERFEDIN